MLSGCPCENMNTFLIMAHSTEEHQAFLSTLCKKLSWIYLILSLPDGGASRKKDGADSGVS